MTALKFRRQQQDADRSQLAALDIHPRVAMQILRHSKIALTMEIYTEAEVSQLHDGQ